MSDPTDALVLTGWRWYCGAAGVRGIALHFRPVPGVCLLCYTAQAHRRAISARTHSHHRSPRAQHPQPPYRSFRIRVTNPAHERSPHHPRTASRNRIGHGSPTHIIPSHRTVPSAQGQAWTGQTPSGCANGPGS